ncbi:MAG: zf-HC2 domain-containing protein [Microlunatus sp.]
MSAESCADLDEFRSAYLDGALEDSDRERLLAHLVDCADCRRDVAEMRHLRSLLTAAGTPDSAPVDLSDRLVSIAGEEATQPLWTRPFRRTPRPGRLPTRQQLVRARVLAAVMGSGLAVLAILGIGYVSAPTVSLASVDPTRQATIEFTTAVSGFPLDGRVSGALQGLAPSASTGADRPQVISRSGRAISEPKAIKLLVNAGEASWEMSYTATQVVTANRDGQQVSNTVQVISRGDAGLELRTVPKDSSAAPVTLTYIESEHSSRIADADLVQLLATHYVLRGWKDQSYGDRPARVVEAVKPETLAPSQAADPTVAAGAAPTAPGELDGVVARWWIDDQMSLILGQETFDGRGNLVTSSRLTDLRRGLVSEDAVSLPASPARTTTALTLSRAAELRKDGWICADRLAGLQLQRIRTDGPTDPDLVHLIYSDGLTTVSVVEQRGRLDDPPAGSIRNETLGAWVTKGMPSTATWSSGDVVLTAVTDGSPVTLAAAVAALPHKALRGQTTIERVRAGWSRVLGR